MRSLLHLSVERPNDLAAGLRSGADALIFDRPEPVARGRAGAPGAAIYIQFDEEWSASEVEAIVAVEPDGILLAGARGDASIIRLSAVLTAYETVAGLDAGATGIVALLTTASGILSVGSLQNTSRRLRGIGWDAAGISASIGAESPWGPEGALIDPCCAARSQCLLLAAAAGVPAFDTIDRRPGRPDSFAAEAETARQDGFAGKFAADADQVSAIMAAFAG